MFSRDRPEEALHPNRGLRHLVRESLMKSFFSETRFHASDLKYDLTLM
jgi:hypothetical protein